MGVYKIKDIELLTGIKAHTIRIWEKRYGILKPERTDTQIRSYSDEELLQLLTISLLNKNGVKISRIAEMSPKEIISKAKALTHSQDNDTVIEQLIVALIQMDETLFCQLLADLTRDHGISQMYETYLLPFLERIGVMWVVGTINPAQEHFISNLIRQKIIAEIDKLPVPEPSDKRILLFLPEHEWHELSLLFYQFHLRTEGIPTIYLGQALPYDALLKSIDFVKPTHIISSWLTAVDESYVHHYFSRLVKETSAKILCSGYQIKLHANKIPSGTHTFASLEELKSQLA